MTNDIFPVDLNNSNFDSTIKENKVVLVDFSATWCGPCKMSAPIIEELAVEFKDKAVIGILDVDIAQDIAVREGVKSVPTFKIYLNGEVVETFVGYKNKDFFISKIYSHL